MRACFILFFGVCLLALAVVSPRAAAADRPNILLAISDDQSHYHTSKAGYAAVKTPAFDRVANEGVYFTHAITASPGCSPSRAALLTGRYCWQLEHAGTHASGFPARYVAYTDLLEGAGYAVGFTGKGWGPGNWKLSGRPRNPAGAEFSRITMEAPEGIRNIDYASNFEAFLKTRDPDQPFCFWYGASEPHRVFKKGIGLEQGKRPEDAAVPAFLPDTPEIRSDLLDYCAEIEWFDQHLARMLDLLEAAGELDNTIVIVTSDNGMAFPRAKANCYEAGIRMPLAIRWGAKVSGGRTVDDLVSLTDLAPTILEATGVAHPSVDALAPPMVGKSLLALLAGEQTEPIHSAVYSARERHSSSRYKSLGYPQRALRTKDYLYIRNFHPERWPAGAPQKYGDESYSDDTTTLGPMHGGYHDIDACPALDFLIEKAEDPELGKYLGWSVDKRPAEELFDVANDPDCINNLAADPAYASVRAELASQMDEYLTETGDPRLVGDGEIFETYPRYSRHRFFPKPDWAE